MATHFSTLLPSNSTDALFRAWVQFIEDTLVTTGGWVVTPDTGQMTIATATAPAAATTKAGYRIYRMDDALQATAPVFVRIDFGSGAAAGTPGIWVTIGQGTNGSGAITDVRYNGGASTTPNFRCSSTSTAGAARNSYGSADTNRCSFAIFLGVNASTFLGFTIERTHDANGNDTAQGIILTGVESALASAGRWSFSTVVLLAAGGQPPSDPGLQFILTSANPGAWGADIGVGVHIPLVGIALPPAIGVIVTRSSDFTPEANFTMLMYGSVRTYQHANLVGACQGTTGTTDANTRVCIRFD